MVALRRISIGSTRVDPCQKSVPGVPSLANGDRSLIKQLRRMARQAQLSSPISIDHACSLIAPAGAQEFGLALMRTLDAVALRPLQFHPVDAAEVGFDELWLIRLLRCLEAGDAASARLLIDTRTQRVGRRAVAYLAQGLAARLMDGDLDVGDIVTS
jgi:hypothetical protein